MPEPTIKDIKKLIKKCPRSPDSKTWNIHKYKNCMILWSFWMSDLSRTEGYYDLVRRLFDKDNQYLGTQVLDYPEIETSPIPYDLEDLLAKRPSPHIRPWTREENSTVETLRLCWIQVEFWAWGDEEDWALLEPLFDGKENYLG